MTANSGQLSISQRLENHNRAVLLKSAQAKIAAGKKLTKQEQRAITDAESAAAPRQEASKQHQSIPATVCAVMLEVRRGEINEARIREVLNITVRTLAEVATAFGIQASTIRSGWRIQGMPGVSGKFNLGEILVWRLKHDTSVAEQAPGLSQRSQSAELREIEIEDKRLDLERKRRRAAIEEGDMVERHKVEREVAALLSVTRERFLRVAAMIEPMLPADVAVEVRVEIEKQIRRQCVSMSEMAARDILNEAHRLEKAS